MAGAPVSRPHTRRHAMPLVRRGVRGLGSCGSHHPPRGRRRRPGGEPPGLMPPMPRAKDDRGTAQEGTRLMCVHEHKIKQRRRVATKVSFCDFCRTKVIGSCKRKWCDQCFAVFSAAKTYKCLNCEKIFKVRGGKDYGIFCSQSCCWKLKRKQSEFIKHLDRIIKKSRRARKAKKSLDAMMRRCKTREQLAEKKKFRNCKQCGKLVSAVTSSGNKTWFCSELCKKIRRKHLRPKGSRKHTTRARKRGLPRIYSITFSKVAERDGWVCGICFQSVSRTIDRHDPMAGCIDHIVPLNMAENTRHGHVWNNVQLAHRNCNEQKGCSVPDQNLLTCDDPRLYAIFQREHIHVAREKTSQKSHVFARGAQKPLVFRGRGWGAPQNATRTERPTRVTLARPEITNAFSTLENKG